MSVAASILEGTIPSVARFCPGCGGKLPDPGSAASRCGGCGYPLPLGDGLEAEFSLEQLFRAQEEAERYYRAGLEQARQIADLQESLASVAAQWPDLGAASRIEAEARPATTAEAAHLHLAMDNLWLAARFWRRFHVRLLDCEGGPALEFRQADKTLPPPFAFWPPETMDAERRCLRFAPDSGVSFETPEWRLLRVLAQYLAQTLADPARIVLASAEKIDFERWRVLAGRLVAGFQAAEAAKVQMLVRQIEQDMGGPLAGDGWYAPEFSPDGFAYRWMGRAARAVFDIAPGPLRLSVRGVWAMCPEALDTFSVSASGAPLTGKMARGAGLAWNYQADIPATARDEAGCLTLDFVSGQVMVPCEVDPASTDSRPLSVSIREIVLVSLDEEPRELATAGG